MSGYFYFLPALIALNDDLSNYRQSSTSTLS